MNGLHSIKNDSEIDLIIDYLHWFFPSYTFTQTEQGDVWYGLRGRAEQMMNKKTATRLYLRRAQVWNAIGRTRYT